MLLWLPFFALFLVLPLGSSLIVGAQIWLACLLLNLYFCLILFVFKVDY